MRPRMLLFILNDVKTERKQLIENYTKKRNLTKKLNEEKLTKNKTKKITIKLNDKNLTKNT